MCLVERRDSSHTFARCYLLDFGGSPLFLLFDNWEVLGRFVVHGSSITSYSEIKRSWESHFCGALPMGIVVTGWSIMLQTYLFVLLYIIKKPSESK